MNKLFNIWFPGDFSVTTIFANGENQALHIFQCHRKIDDKAMQYVKIKQIY